MDREKSRGKLKLNLLGSPEVWLGGQVVTGFRSGKAKALLYYLAVTGRAQPRSVLAGLFWGGVAESHARRSLTMTLSNLRRLLGSYLDIDRETIAFKLDSAYGLDVAAFDSEVEGMADTVNLEALKQAIALYRGDFLEGFYLQDAPEFEQWVLVERTRLRERMLQALHLLADHLAAQDDLPQAIEAIRRLLTLEPWREEAHRYLMMLLAQGGQRSVALAQFEICCQMLTDELGVEPDPLTVALYERIRDGEFSREAGEQGSKAVSFTPARPHPSPAAPQPYLSSRPSTFQHSLPAQPTAFVGRERELADIIRRLTDRDCRLLTLVGPGGIGKTRLALQTARRLIDDDSDRGFFEHGVLFVPLAAVESIDGLVSAMAEAANFSFYSNVPPQQQLLDFLQEKELLLVLDNLEHLLSLPERGIRAGAIAEGETVGGVVKLIAEILTAAPSVKILVTSREALNLQEAWFHPVKGLSFPPQKQPFSTDNESVNSSDPISLEQYDAVQLFAQSAARARVEFSLVTEQAAVVYICQLVEGMPLAIELAAAWLKTLSVAEIATEIERDLDILATRHQNVPERHRSMRVVLTQSWQQLTEPEQGVFKRLSVFRGGFAAEAARLVAGASLINLATFVETSLLYVTSAGRYQMHELLRQYAAEKLAEAPQDVAEVYDHHCTYYAEFLHQRSAGLLGGRQRLNLAEIAAEYDNVWAAWRWAVKAGKVAEIRNSIASLQYFCQFQGKFLEGANAWEEAVDFLYGLEPTEQVNLTLVETLIWWGWLLIRLGQLDTAETALKKCHDLYQQLGTPPVPGYGTDPTLALSLIATIRGDYDTAVWYGEQARQESETHPHAHNLYQAHYVLASATLEQGDYQAAQQHAQQALALAQRAEDRWFIPYCLNELGRIALALNEMTTAQEHLEASYAIRQEFNDPPGMAVALNHLGEIALHQQAYIRALALYQESLDLYQDIPDKGGRAMAHKGFGTAASKLGRFETANYHLHQALQLAVQIHYVPLMFSILNVIGEFWLKIGRLEPGLRLLAFVREHASSHRPAQAEAQQLLDKFRSTAQKEQLNILAMAQEQAKNQSLTDVVTGVIGAKEGQRNFQTRGIVI